MTVPSRYWIWQSIYGNSFRFDPSEAEHIATALDSHTEATDNTQLMFVTATDLAGSEVRLHINFCDAFYETTDAIRAADAAMNEELTEKPWDQ